MVDILGFNIALYMPLMLIAFILFHLFDLYGKILDKFDMPAFDSGSEEAKRKIAEGFD